MLRRILRWVVRAIVVVLVLGWTVLDGVFGPVLRPLFAWMAGLRLFEAIGMALGRAPPYVALALLAVPLLLVEPLKLVGVYVMARHHVVIGGWVIVGAEILSLLTTDRVFHAAYEPLMRIGWFRVLMDWLTGIRDRAVALATGTAVWRWGKALALKVGRWAREVVRRGA